MILPFIVGSENIHIISMKMHKKLYHASIHPTSSTDLIYNFLETFHQMFLMHDASPTIPLECRKPAMKYEPDRSHLESSDPLIHTLRLDSGQHED